MLTTLHLYRAKGYSPDRAYTANRIPGVFRDQMPVERTRRANSSFPGKRSASIVRSLGNWVRKGCYEDVASRENREKRLELGILR